MYKIKNTKFLLCLAVLIFCFFDWASAHQSGCHRWHSCPSDSGSYICGDAGYPCLYPTYPASGGVIYPPSGYYKDCYDCPLKKVPNNAYTDTSGIGWSCSSGYKKSGDVCIKDSSSENNKTCASVYINSSWDGTYSSDNKKIICDCKSGYTWNNTRTACVSNEDNNKICIKDYINSSWDGTYSSDGKINCVCDYGYVWNKIKNICISEITNNNNKSCIDTFGNSSWDGTYSLDKKQINCICDSGYAWNSAGTTCVAKTLESKNQTGQCNMQNLNLCSNEGLMMLIAELIKQKTN